MLLLCLRPHISTESGMLNRLSMKQALSKIA